MKDMTKADALTQVYREFECSHGRQEIRERSVRGGGKQFVYQCMICGEPCSNAMSRDAATRANGSAPLPFDEKLRINRKESLKKAVDAVEADYLARAESKTSDFWNFYKEYLKSTEWKKRRALVMRRCNGVCEGCGLEMATQVHHFTYEHVGNEFLFELVAVCDACHERIHAESGEGDGEP